MVAIAVEAPNVLKLFPEPQPADPGPGEIRMRVVRAGICGSDIHILHGSNPFAVYPRIIGHEVAGTVEALGEGVSGLAVGDQVALDPVLSCGVCHPCRIGRPNVCARLQVFGVHRDGGYRDRFCLPAGNAVKVPASLTAAIAALAEPFSIAANVLSRTGCSADDSLLIYGAGTVGLTVLQVARLHGARCIVSDIDDGRLERARGFGADLALNPQRDDVPARVGAELDGLGPSLVIDGAGMPALLGEACRVAAPAGRIGILGFSPQPTPIEQRLIVQKELSLYGSRLNRRLLPQVVQWLSEGKLKPAEMITQEFDSADAAAAFAHIEAHPASTIKVQLRFA